MSTEAGVPPGAVPGLIHLPLLHLQPHPVPRPGGHAGHGGPRDQGGGGGRCPLFWYLRLRVAAPPAVWYPSLFAQEAATSSPSLTWWTGEGGDSRVRLGGG